MPLLSHIFYGRATSDFQIWKIGPVLAAVPHAGRPWPPSTSTASPHTRRHPRRRPRHHRLIVLANAMAMAPKPDTARGDESEKWENPPPAKLSRPLSVPMGNVMLAKSAAGH